MRRSPTLILCGLVLALVGCGPKPTPTTPPPPGPSPGDPSPVALTPPPQPGKPKADARDYWKYDGGHLARGARNAWYEHNAEAEKSRNGKWEFREVARTPEHVELYDASRAVQVRLTGTDMLARWDKDGKDAEWKSLQKGKWGRE